MAAAVEIPCKKVLLVVLIGTPDEVSPAIRLNTASTSFLACRSVAAAFYGLTIPSSAHQSKCTLRFKESWIFKIFVVKTYIYQDKLIHNMFVHTEG